jgi:hypothetical protein
MRWRLIPAFFAFCCACALSSAACGSNMSPSRIDVAGSWSGTWQFQTGGATVTDSVTAQLTQTGTNASGTWTAAGGPSGELSFAVGASISGTLTINQTTVTGQTCRATTTVSGTASSSTIAFTMTTPTSSGICQWATSNQFSLQR